MERDNPFAPPTSQVTDIFEPRPFKAVSLVALGAITLQLLFSGIYMPVFFALVKDAQFHAIQFFLYLVGTGLLTAGGISLLRKRSAATVWFGIAMLFSFLSLLQQKPLVSITGAVVNLLAVIASGLQFKVGLRPGR